MKLVEQSRQQVGVVFLYDPLPLEKVSLDLLKADFPTVTSFLPDEEILTAESTEKKVWAQIFSSRTEFVDQNVGGEFSLADLKLVERLLSALPPLQVKSFGVNLHVRGTAEGYEVAGRYVTENFLKSPDALEEKLGAKIIASAQRFSYGDVAKYYDVRITPEELSGPLLHLQMHRHVDLQVSESQRLFEATEAAFSESLIELGRIIKLL